MHDRATTHSLKSALQALRTNFGGAPDPGLRPGLPENGPSGLNRSRGQNINQTRVPRAHLVSWVMTSRGYGFCPRRDSWSAPVMKDLAVFHPLNLCFTFPNNVCLCWTGMSGGPVRYDEGGSRFVGCSVRCLFGGCPAFPPHFPHFCASFPFSVSPPGNFSVG